MKTTTDKKKAKNKNVKVEVTLPLNEYGKLMKSLKKYDTISYF